MTKKSENAPKPKRVAEPVQVYLDATDRARLDRLTSHLAATKSDVLRQALEALELRVTDPAEHPALRIIGLAGTATRESDAYDIAREHDRYLADAEFTSWSPPPKLKRGR